MSTVLPSKKAGKIEKVLLRLPPPQRIPSNRNSESHLEPSGTSKPKEPKFVPFEPYKAAVSPLFVSEAKAQERATANIDISSKTLIPVTKSTKQSDRVALVHPNVLSPVEDEKCPVEENVNDKKKINRLEEEIYKLKEEKFNLESQLHSQTKINSELKKLLVASVGEDLECRVQFLTEDKVKLAQDVNHYVQRLLADHEELEKLSIQCDVWRSKFLASSLIVDELAKWKAKLYHRYDETLEALYSLLEEHQQLKDNLRITYGYLRNLQKSFDRTSAPSHSFPKPQTILEMSLSMKKLSSSLQLRLLGSSTLSPELVSSVSEELTNGEQKAQMMLTNPGLCHLPAGSCGHDSCNRITTPHSGTVHRFHPNTRYEHLTMNCCAQCMGDIQLL